MTRIAGIDLDTNKRVDFALTSIYGIGRNNVRVLLNKTKIDGSTRVKDLTDEETARLQKIIDTDYTVEGDLRRSVSDNIKRLRAISSYRGSRHARGLPVHGQRTRTNARTKRGKRKTVGAIKKEDRPKTEEDK